MSLLLLLRASAGGAVALAGTASSASGSTGTLAVTRPLAGSAGASAHLTITRVDRALAHAGNASASAGVTPALDAGRALQGGSFAASGATGGVAAIRGLTSTSSASSGATGATDVARGLAGGAFAASGAASSANVDRALSAIAANASGAPASLGVVRTFAAVLPAASGGQFTLGVQRAIAVTLPASSGATGDLTKAGQVPLTGVIAAAADLVAAQLIVLRPLGGVAPATSGGRAALSAERAFAAIASNSARVAQFVPLSVTRSLAAALHATGLLADAELARLLLLGGVIPVSAAAGADLAATIPWDATTVVISEAAGGAVLVALTGASAPWIAVSGPIGAPPSS